MKRIIILAAVLLVAASCSVTRDRVTRVYYADYTTHPDMWISPNSCPLDHEVLGQLSIVIEPGYVEKKLDPNEHKKGGVYGMGNTPVNATIREEISHDELLEMAVVEAKAKGANGISNFEILTKRLEYGTITEYTVNGLLIRVK